MPRLTIIALGSILMGDDGAGAYALKLLEATRSVPEDVELLDLGTPGPEFASYLAAAERVIVIDTVKARDAAAGEIRAYDRAAIVAGGPAPRFSPHDPSLAGALLTAELTGEAPSEVVLVGVVPARVEMGTELSPVVKEALPGLVDEVAARARSMGIELAPRPGAPAPDVWWERR